MAPQSQSLLNSPRGKHLLAVLCAVAFLDFADASITNVALPHIRTALGFSVQTRDGARRRPGWSSRVPPRCWSRSSPPSGCSYLPNILPGLMLVAFGVGPVFVGVTAAANAGAAASQASSPRS